MDAQEKNNMLTFMRNIRSCSKLVEYFSGDSAKIAKYLAIQQENIDQLSKLIVKAKLTEF